MNFTRINLDFDPANSVVVTDVNDYDVLMSYCSSADVRVMIILIGLWGICLGIAVWAYYKKPSDKQYSVVTEYFIRWFMIFGLIAISLLLPRML